MLARLAAALLLSTITLVASTPANATCQLAELTPGSPAHELWRSITEEAERSDVSALNRADPGHDVPVLAHLPEGIPTELQAAFQALNEAMGDTPRFLKWLIALELEIQSRLEPGKSPDEQRSLAALQAVISERARRAGWPEPIYILPASLKRTQWRPMLGKGHLFIDAGLSGKSHGGGSHLLQLLYASEVLGANAALRNSPVFKERPVLPTLMAALGGSYQSHGRTFDPDSVAWGALRNTSGWEIFFDHWDRRAPNSPEHFGQIRRALPNLQHIEAWGWQPANYP